MWFVIAPAFALTTRRPRHTGQSGHKLNPIIKGA
jgi:hypothetical protein